MPRPHADHSGLDRLLDRAGDGRLKRAADPPPPGRCSCPSPPRHAAPLAWVSMASFGALPWSSASHNRSGSTPSARPSRRLRRPRDARPEDEVVDHLATCPAPPAPDGRCPRQTRRRRVCRARTPRRSCAVDKEACPSRGRFPARERDVEKNEIFSRGAQRPLRIARRNRRTERDDEARPRALEHALPAEDDFFDSLSKRHDDDEIARSRCFPTRRGCAAAPRRERFVPCFLEWS